MKSCLVVTPTRFGHRAIFLTLLLVNGYGCSKPDSPRGQPGNTEKTLRVEAGSNRIEPEERWEAIYLKGSKIGHQHVYVDYAERGKPDVLKIRSTISLTLHRSGQPTPMSIDVTSVEHSDGRLMRFDAVQGNGAGRLVTKGEVRKGKLYQQVQRAGKTARSEIPWKDSWGGLFAVDSSLLRNPMKPGETRRLQALVPILFQPADVRLQAHGFEKTRLIDGSKKLLKVQVTFTVGTLKLEEYRWVDSNGQSYKNHAPQTQQTAYRTTKSIALEPATGEQVDVAALSSVSVNRKLDKPHETKRVVYRASVSSGDLENVFERGASQSVHLIDDQTAEIVVRAITPDDPVELTAKEAAPTEEFLESNTMIQSDDELIQQIARTIAADMKDPWSVALTLESYVNSYITEANFTQAFDTAAEVAVNRKGDCTEHAVLLAALCRARSIPARVATGLVYLSSGEKGVFAYHMWTEVWIKDRWIPLDATLAQGGIGAAHIKLVTSSLAGASPQSVFLPVAHVVGRLKLEVVEVR